MKRLLAATVGLARLLAATVGLARLLATRRWACWRRDCSLQLFVDGRRREDGGSLQLLPSRSFGGWAMATRRAPTFLMQDHEKVEK